MEQLNAYIRKECVIGAIINAVISAAFFIGFFRGQGQIALWGEGGLVLDSAPQGLLAGLASALAPSLITKARLRSNTAPLVTGKPPKLPQSMPLRCAVLALSSMIILTGGVALLAMLTGVEAIAFWPAFVAKIAVGAAIALAITPLAIRAMLVRPPI